MSSCCGATEATVTGFKRNTSRQLKVAAYTFQGERRL